MKATLFGAVLFTFAAGLVAAEYPEFTAGMKALGNVSGTLRKVDKKTGPEVVRGAERMAAVYEEMIGFWRQRGAANAVKWSEEGKAAAVQMASAANAGDAEKVDAAMKALNGTCQSCHEAYRERTPDGKYRFKPESDK